MQTKKRIRRDPLFFLRAEYTLLREDLHNLFIAILNFNQVVLA